MSSLPRRMVVFSDPSISLASRSASSTPRRWIPTSTRPSAPPPFSTISLAIRTKVRPTAAASRREVVEGIGGRSYSEIGCFSRRDEEGDERGDDGGDRFVFFLVSFLVSFSVSTSCLR